MNAILRTALAVLVLHAAVSVNAQTGQVAHPADPSAPAPAPKHESAFEGYRQFQEPKIASWRAANEELGGLRGHIDHIKEGGAEPDKAPMRMNGGAHPAQAPMHRHAK